MGLLTFEDARVLVSQHQQLAEIIYKHLVLIGELALPRHGQQTPRVHPEPALSYMCGPVKSSTVLRAHALVPDPQRRHASVVLSAGHTEAYRLHREHTQWMISIKGSFPSSAPSHARRYLLSTSALFFKRQHTYSRAGIGDERSGLQKHFPSPLLCTFSPP